MKPDPKILTFFNETPPAPEIVLPGLRLGKIGSIVSPGGQGKSMLAMELACSVAAGRNFIGVDWFQPVKRRVCYITAEDGSDIFHERFHAFGQYIEQYGSAWRDQIAAGMEFHDLSTNNPNLLEREWLDYLASCAYHHELIFLDTLSSLHTGDENNNGEMARLVGSIRSIAAQYHCSIIFLHHTSKQAALQGMGGVSQASRGASALTDNIRWQAYLKGLNKAEIERLGLLPDQWYVEYGISKQNHGRAIEPVYLSRDENGLLHHGLQPSPDAKDWK